MDLLRLLSDHQTSSYLIVLPIVQIPKRREAKQAQRRRNPGGAAE
jgi:hypothetical protein